MLEIIKNEYFNNQLVDSSYLESNILQNFANDQQNKQYVQQQLTRPEPSVTTSPHNYVQPQTTSSASLTEEELLSSLMQDGSVSFKQDETTEKKSGVEKKFAGGSWSNSPHPSKLPKPQFN